MKRANNNHPSAEEYMLMARFILSKLLMYKLELFTYGR